MGGGGGISFCVHGMGVEGNLICVHGALSCKNEGQFGNKWPLTPN